MATLERSGSTTPTSSRNPLAPWVVVLSVLVVGLAGWIAWDLFFVEDAAPVPEVADLVDDFIASLDEYDTEAAEALVMPSFATNVAGPVTGVDGAITWLEANDAHATIVGPMISQVEGDWTVVAAPISGHVADESVDEGTRFLGTVVLRGNDTDGYRISAFWLEMPSMVTPRVG